MTKTISVSDETFEKFKNELGLGEKNLSLKDVTTFDALVGRRVVLRCASTCYHGTVLFASNGWFVLTDASNINWGYINSDDKEAALISNELPGDIIVKEEIKAIAMAKW